MKERTDLFNVSQKIQGNQISFGRPIRILHSNNAKEYCSTPFNSFADTNGISSIFLSLNR